ncbi:MAG: hypothetical protein V9F01_10825 [Chitinophagaceae bacterium]
MEQKKYTKYYNPQLKIGLISWREAWLFNDGFPEKLYTEVYKGKLVFRQRGTSTRISYHRLRQQLIVKRLWINEPPLPF